MKKCLLIAALVLTGSATAQAQIPCDRACLTGFVDTWFEALADNNPGSVPMANNAKITSNGKTMPLAQTFWDSAENTTYRWDIVNPRLGDTGTEAVIQNSDGSETMLMLRLKVVSSQITEVEIIKANEGDAGGLWGPQRLVNAPVSRALQLSIREAERDSYYGLIAAAESYWRAFQTNGTEQYHQADLAPDTERFENGLQTTGFLPDGSFRSTAEGFDRGSFIGRNLWDRRYAVVDEERGIVLSIVRFGLKDGMESQSAATTHDRLVGEFFAIKGGMIQEVHAVLFNLVDSEPTGWGSDYGPGKGGW